MQALDGAMARSVADRCEHLILEISEFERVRAEIDKLPVSGKGNGRYWRRRKLAELDRQIDERKVTLGALILENNNPGLECSQAHDRAQW